MIKSWSYKEEYKILRKPILKSIDKSLKTGNIFFGNELDKFEKNFKKYNKFKYGVAVGSGTDALYISLMAMNIGKGDEVITVSNSAIPTVSAIYSVGASVKFVDVGKDYLIDADSIEKVITRKTKAIIPVHLYGQACDMEKILKIANKYNLKVIEDCAQAQGAKYKNRYVGNFGHTGCFSFYPTKILGAYGDGGFVGTNDKKLYQKINEIRFYGINQTNKKDKFFKKYYSNRHGINSRISEMECSILNLKLPLVNTFISKRLRLANNYKKELKNTSLYLPLENKNCKHVFHLFVVFHPKREVILKKLKAKKINLIINYPYPIHKMKGYKNIATKTKLLNTEKFSKGIFSLPLYPGLNIKNQLNFIKVLKDILSKV